VKKKSLHHWTPGVLLPQHAHPEGKHDEIRITNRLTFLVFHARFR